jgi:hypothetical protein
METETYAAEAAADVAEPAAELAAELADAARLDAALAALAVSEPKTVLKPVVVTTAEPAEFVTVPTRGMVVTALRAADASEPVTEAAADAAAPLALARADDRMGRAGRAPEALAETPAH